MQPVLSHYHELYRRDLTENILPFWLRHGLDRVNGGVYTCVDRDGTLMDSTKSVWFQGRCAWVYAAAYNSVEQRPEYLEMAKSCIDFIEAHCIDTDGRMYFEVMADGTPLRKRRYVFSECFAAIAMSEYAIATGDKSYAERALRLFHDIQRFIATPELTPAKYLPTLQAEGHSITMILINTAACIRRALPHPSLDEQIERSINALRTLFVHPEYKCVLEMVTPDGQLIDTIAGRTINPGHCIETAWFLLEEARRTLPPAPPQRGGENGLTTNSNTPPLGGGDGGRVAEVKKLALQILDWSWEWGWDKQYGGIINFRDCKGFPAQDYSQDMKFWWPQTEAIIATLYAYEATGDGKYLEWHRMAHDWAYKHLPDAEHGEWYGYLHRDGTVAQPAKGNLFKGPFHIPRMMIKAQEIISRL